MYKLHIYQDEYGEMYDRRYPITIVMPNNGEKGNNISKNPLLCDIVNNTHNFPLNIAEEKNKNSSIPISTTYTTQKSLPFHVYMNLHLHDIFSLHYKKK